VIVLLLFLFCHDSPLWKNHYYLHYYIVVDVVVAIPAIPAVVVVVAAIPAVFVAVAVVVNRLHHCIVLDLGLIYIQNFIPTKNRISH
jgi:hypothetical protein